MASRTWLRRRPTTSANLVPSVAGDSDGTHEPEKLPCRLDSHESRVFVFCSGYPYRVNLKTGHRFGPGKDIARTFFFSTLLTKMVKSKHISNEYFLNEY